MQLRGEQMRKQVLYKALAIFLTVRLTVGVSGSNSYAMDNNSGSGLKADALSGISAQAASGASFMAVSGASLKATSDSSIYYVGGPGASDSNTGATQATAFATLSQAMQTINAAGPGKYQILVLGNTTEAQEITVGSDTAAVNVAIAYDEASAVSGSAIITRNQSYKGKMIYIKKNSSLRLGDISSSSDEALVFDGNKANAGSASSIIYNEGSLILDNGITLQNNYSSLGSGIYNRSGSILISGGRIRSNGGSLGVGLYNYDGNVTMTGGMICLNKSNSGGGIYVNNGSINLTGGEISENSSYQGGGIYNSNGSINIAGTRISNNNAINDGGGIYNIGNLVIGGDTQILSNTAEKNGGGIYNCKYLTLQEGIISNNSVEESGGGVCNAGRFLMQGGTIFSNKAVNTNASFNTKGGGVYSQEDFTMSGGLIGQNEAKKGAAVYTMYPLILSGTASIPAGTGNQNDVFLNDKIILNKGWNGNTDDAIAITMYRYGDTDKIIDDQSGNNISIKSKFVLKNAPSGFSLNSEGRLIFNDHEVEVKVCYVNSDSGMGSDSTGDGTSAKPYATLEYAVSQIEATPLKKGTIYLQSNTALERPLVISGDIAIMADPLHNDDCEISQTAGFTRHTDMTYFDDGGGMSNFPFLIMNVGTLGLGKVTATDETAPDIIINSGANYSVIYNAGLLLMCSNTRIANNKTSAVYNRRVFHMYGGSIDNNFGWGIENEGVFHMDGTGGIRNNRGGVTNSGWAQLSQGTIDSNSGTMTAGGILNLKQFYMDGGEITNNRGMNAGGICSTAYSNNHLETVCNISGGLISDNISSGGFGNGIYSSPGSNLCMSGNIKLNSNDIGMVANSTYPQILPITISDELTDASAVFNISRKYYNGTVFTDYAAIGDKILTCKDGYKLTAEAAARFLIPGTDGEIYMVNQDGNLGYNIGNLAINITSGTIYYNGTARQVAEISVKKGDTPLTENVDYIVAYENNINAGNSAVIKIIGINSYAGLATSTFTINKATIQSIITKAVNKSFKACSVMSLNALKDSIGLTQAEVNINSGVISVPLTWELKSGSYNSKGGTYEFTGSITDSANIEHSDLTLKAVVTVSSCTPVNPVFNKISVIQGTDKKATADKLGEDILPKSGMLTLEGSSLHYTIDWDKKTLDTTDLSASTTFTGKLTYQNFPEWATLPDNLTVTRTVGVKENSATKPSDNTDTVTPTPMPVPTTAPVPSSTPVTTPAPVATLTPVPTTVPKISEPIIINGKESSLQISINTKTDENKLEAALELSEETLKSLTGKDNDEKLKVDIPLGSEKLIEAINEGNESEVNLVLSLPEDVLSNKKIDLSGIELNSGILKAAKEKGKDVTAAVTDENGKVQYSWTFAGSSLETSEQQISNVNLALTIETAGQNKELEELLGTGSQDNKAAGQEGTTESIKNAFVINFSQDGVLPAPATVKIYVGDKRGLKPGDSIYLYHYNQSTNKLETLPGGYSYQVDSDGYITITIVHCSKYVVLDEKADKRVITSLKDQIKVVASDKTLYLEDGKIKKGSIKVSLPSTLKLSEKLENESKSIAVENATASYKSSNSKVVAVNKKGIITAVGSGTAKIYTKVTLYNGTSKVFILVIKVKK